jgi:hypothetical protein
MNPRVWGQFFMTQKGQFRVTFDSLIGTVGRRFDNQAFEAPAAGCVE